MSSSDRNLSEGSTIAGDFSTSEIVIVRSLYYEDITKNLFEGCFNELSGHGIRAIHEIQVPGAFELIAGARKAIDHYPAAKAVICLGCVIKGETDHDKYINHAVAQGLGNLTIQFNIPFIFGLLTPNNMQQALDRSGGKHGNKGIEAAHAALSMIR